MNKTLVIVPQFAELDGLATNVGEFHASALIFNLVKEPPDGVTVVAPNAWIFDMRFALDTYARIVNEACRRQVRVVTFELPHDINVAQFPACMDIVTAIRS